MNAHHEHETDHGFGLVEVVVAMLVLAVVFLSFGALLTRSLTEVVENGTRATAAQLATERLELARAEARTGSCTNLATVLATPSTVQDGRGVDLTVSGVIAPGTCDQPAGDEHGNPRLATVTVEVTSTKASGTKVETSLSTDIWVKAATS